jgi:hypothetical protein
MENKTQIFFIDKNWARGVLVEIEYKKVKFKRFFFTIKIQEVDLVVKKILISIGH